jgi:ABC-type transport system involved in multi-copper enzyme maturation permease subunit
MGAFLVLATIIIFLVAISSSILALMVGRYTPGFPTLRTEALDLSWR